MPLRRAFFPSVSAEAGAAALARAGGARATAQALVRGGGLVQSGIPVAWALEDDGAGPGTTEPLPMRELSAETGGFGVCIDASREADQAGCAVFFAGRTVERSPSGPVQRTHADFAELYRELTGWPYPEPEEWAGLPPVQAMSGQIAPRRDEEQPLALAVFPLVEAGEFAAACNAPATDWVWHAAATAPAGIPYVLLTRQGRLDTALFDALAGKLDVTAAAVGLSGSGVVPFDWWRSHPSQRGTGAGARALVKCLLPAVTALGERPGILRLECGK